MQLSATQQNREKENIQSLFYLECLFLKFENS